MIFPYNLTGLIQLPDKIVVRFTQSTQSLKFGRLRADRRLN
jgi:hypothetical protein